MLLCQLSNAQVGTYGFSQTLVAASYTPLTTPTNAFVAPWDDNVSPLINLGFTFRYNGVNQTQCYISSNGFISFGVAPTTTNYLPLSTPTPFTNGGVISALGMDLKAGATDAVVYRTIGASPSRVFVVQWTNARRQIMPGNFNFQIRLLEGSNNIEFSYGVCAPTDAAVYNAQVGLRGVTNDFFQSDIENRIQTGTDANATWFNKTAPGTANSNTVRTSATEYPDTGLRYIFTPAPACVTPTASPTALVVGATSVSTTSFVGNSFTAAAPAPTNYLILRSTVNTVPTAASVPNRVYWAINDVIAGIYTVIGNTNTTTFTQTGLTPNTTYFYWVIPYNEGCLGGPFYRLSSILTASKTTCISEPLNINTSNVGGNSFTATWSAVTGATNYRIDVSTTNTFSAILPAYSNQLTGNVTSFPVTGLNPLTTYYFRVRAIGISCNVDSISGSATTICGSFPIPYFQNFDTTPVASIPTCFSLVDDNLDSVVWQVQNSIAASTPNAMHLNTNTTLDADDWFFSPGLNLTSGVTYRLRFKYNTVTAGAFIENFLVRLGNLPTVADMNITILDLENITNTVYQTASVDFTIVTSGTYYLGFQGYSFANQSKIIVDDLSIIVSPTCFEPTAILINSVTTNTATISWEPPSNEPALGYQYFVSTSSTVPSSSATPTGSVGPLIYTATITGLLPATFYYVWVRGNCSAVNQSVWSEFQTFGTDCSTPTLIGVTNGNACGGGTATLQATPIPGSVIEWYAEATGETLLATGNSFVTPPLLSNTTYYAQSKTSGGLSSAGPSDPVSQGGTRGAATTTTFISFSVSSPSTLQSFDIYPLVSGQNGTLTVRNASNSILGTYPYVTNVAGGNTPQTINIGRDLTVGSYFIYMDVLPAAGLIRNTNNADYPYNSSIASITGNSFDIFAYMYLYNWKFSNICRSLLTPVTASVVAAPTISLSTTSVTICFASSTPTVTVSGSQSYDTFVWTPANDVAGSIATGYTFSPFINTTYTLTASQTSGSLCYTTASINVRVRAQPPAITVTPASATLCQGNTQSLNATFAAATPITIFNENFNALTNNWVRTTASVGGNTANTAWTLRNSPYTYTSSSWNVTLSSNDASRFYFSNSDASGSPSSNRTITYLESPTISLAGYASATLSFWHYLKYISTNKARVEASIDGGTTWVLLTAFTASRGTASGFVNATVDMTPVVGNPAVKFRFYYDATWDYGWAIDNVSIRATLAVEVVWTPTTNLFFNAAATVPYIAGTPAAVVYAKPNVTTTYTATTQGVTSCSISNTSTLTVTPTPISGVLSGTQSVCANWPPTALTITGSSGTIIRWEYATDAAFTIGLTTIANTNTSLTPAQIGTFTGTRHYRAVFQNGTCPIVYSNSVSVSFPVTTWNGTAWSNGLPNATTKAVFNGNFTSTADVQACSVEVLTGVVTISSVNTLNVQNDVKVTGGSLIFQNTASLVQVNALNNLGVPFTNTGNITYRRNSTPVRKFDYTFWSSPVSPQTLMVFSPGTSLFYTFNSATGFYNSALGTDVMIPAKGYLIRTPDVAPFNTTTTTIFNGSFVGVPNTGTITIPILGTGNRVNLIGNPYPCALSANLFLSDPLNVPVIGGTIYLWTHNTPITANNYSANDYALYNFTGGVGTGTAALSTGVNNSVPNGRIAAGQGFFVNRVSDGVATFKNSMRLVGNNNQFFKQSNPTNQTSAIDDLERHRFWLDIYHADGAFKQLLIGYIQNATNSGLDRGFDGELVDVGNRITLYAIQENIKLSIQGRALPFNEADIIPIGYKSTIAGTYTIKLSNFDGLFEMQNIYIEDNVLNIIHDLKAGDYSFTTETGTFNDRFNIRFTGAALNTTTPVFNANQVVIYKNPEKEFVISTGTNIMSSIKVFDIRGRLLLQKKEINAAQTSFIAGLTNEVLLVQITTIDGVVVTKRVIR